MFLIDTIRRLLEKEPEFDGKVKYFKQRFDYDCGQTCLDMLGYDGHGMFPTKNGMVREDLESIPGFRVIERESLRNSNKVWDLSFPEPVLIDIRTFKAANHYVIGFKRFIYCPSLGVHHTLVYPRKADGADWGPNNVHYVPPVWKDNGNSKEE